MHPDILGSVDMASMTLFFDPPYKGNRAAHLLRGAIGRNFQDPIFHQHQEGVLYRYPLVQYRWANNRGVIAGINEGAGAITGLSLAGRVLDLEGQKLAVREAELDFWRKEISVSPVLQRYYFKSPWLPFHQENYRKYRQMGHREKTVERDRLLVANLLTTLKSLGIQVPCRLYASFFMRKSLPCRYKEEELVGFLGDVVTNVVIPSGLGIGKAVSHGYGWLAIECERNDEGE